MDTLFFLASKLIGAFLRADTYIILAFAVIALALHAKRHRVALRLSIGTFIACLTIGMLPLGDLLLASIERTYPVHPPLTRVTGIVLLGGAEDAFATAHWKQVQLNEGGERFTAALALARRFPMARLLFTGGSGSLRTLVGGSVSESTVAERFFAEHGITAPRLQVEGASRNTAENAQLGFAVAKPQAGETWVLVTTAFHMPRAMRTFAAAGWPPMVPWPVDHRTAAFADRIGWDPAGHLELLNIAIKERVGQIAYRITGR